MRKLALLILNSVQQLLDFALTSRPNLTRNPITAVKEISLFQSPKDQSV